MNNKDRAKLIVFVFVIALTSLSCMGYTYLMEIACESLEGGDWVEQDYLVGRPYDSSSSGNDHGCDKNFNQANYDAWKDPGYEQEDGSNQEIADEEEAPVMEPIPEPDEVQDTEENFEPNQESIEQPEAESDPQPQPEPEPDHDLVLDELGQCSAAGEIVQEKSEVEVATVNDDQTGEMQSQTCHYFIKLISEASEPVVILYNWHEYTEHAIFPENIYHWKYHGPIPAGGNKEFLQELSNIRELGVMYLEYSRLLAFVAIYDRDECQQYINSNEMMSYQTPVRFECKQYIPDH